MIDNSKAIQSLKPGAKWIMRGDDLEWLDEDQTEPTASQISDEVVRLQAAEPLRLLRIERNAKLAETDWEIVMHKEKGTNIPTELKTYRQALRDITDSATSLDDVTWPEKP